MGIWFYAFLENSSYIDQQKVEMSHKQKPACKQLKRLKCTGDGGLSDPIKICNPLCKHTSFSSLFLRHGHIEVDAELR